MGKFEDVIALFTDEVLKIHNDVKLYKWKQDVQCRWKTVSQWLFPGKSNKFLKPSQKCGHAADTSRKRKNAKSFIQKNLAFEKCTLRRPFLEPIFTWFRPYLGAKGMDSQSITLIFHAKIKK